MVQVTVRARVPKNRRLVIDVPEAIPEGDVEVTLVSAGSGDGNVAAILAVLDTLVPEPKYGPSPMIEEVERSRAEWDR